MLNRIRVEINPLPNYSRYASSDYILCGIDFYLNRNGEEHHFRSQSSNNCIDELLKEIDDFLSDNLPVDTELCYYVPWILGEHCVYPYSFKIKDSETWSFRYKRNQNDDQFDFECDIYREDIISMQAQIKKQISKIDWDSLGKTQIYTFTFPEREVEWCYSAKAFCKALNELCDGHSIEKVYVSATNYADPLRVAENYVNYYLGAEVIIQFEGFLLDLFIYAEGLFEWCVFQHTEYTVNGPTLKCIEDGDEEFCDIGDVYGMFKADYVASAVKKVEVTETKSWPWSAKTFDEAKLGKPIELPQEVSFQLTNGNSLSFYGAMDDFVISLSLGDL